jgi:hypothetical protein
MSGSSRNWAVQRQLSFGPANVVDHAHTARPSVGLLPELRDREVLKANLARVINLGTQDHSELFIDPGPNRGWSLGFLGDTFEHLTPPAITQFTTNHALFWPMKKFHAQFTK